MFRRCQRLESFGDKTIHIEPEFDKIVQWFKLELWVAYEVSVG